ncbi:MAG: hypothetical protein ACLR8Y_08130 [Alistipes indistinctus]
MVVSKLDEQTLEQIALATGGGYIRATNRSLGLDEITEDRRGEKNSHRVDFRGFQRIVPVSARDRLALLLLDFDPERRAASARLAQYFPQENDSGDPV